MLFQYRLCHPVLCCVVVAEECDVADDASGDGNQEPVVVVVCAIIVVVGSENSDCFMTLLSVVGSGFWVPFNAPAVQEIDILLSEVCSTSSCVLETVVVIESRFA